MLEMDFKINADKQNIIKTDAALAMLVSSLLVLNLL
jgi:hypothetical protein